MTGRTFKGLFAAVLVTAALAFGFALPTNAYAVTYEGTQTVELSEDVTDVVIAAGANVTINLNGHKISSSADTTAANNMHHAITNNGTLIVNGSGTIDGGVYANSGAVYTAPGATTTLNGGTYTGSKWYVIKNLGTMIINDGATITSNNRGSSVIDNGYYGDPAKYPQNDCWLMADGTNKPSLTVNGGVFNADPNDFTSIKNDDYGIVVVNGGTFTGTCAISNHYIATINEGSFTSESNWVLQNCPCNSTSDVGELTINGGTFIYNGSASTGIFQYLNESNNFGFIKIYAGTFSDDPSKYVATDYRATDNGDGTYSVVKGGAEGEATADTDSKTSIDESTLEEVSETATDTAKSLKDSAEAINTEENTVAGLKVENAAAIAEVVNSAKEADTINVELEVSAKASDTTDEIIEGVKKNTETASYFDIGVTMSVSIKSAETGATSEPVTTPVTDLGESEVEATVTVDKEAIAGKYVRIARVHDGEVDYLDASVNYETGAITFKTSKFSAYAALYSTNVAVTFDANGGKWSDETTQKVVNTGSGLTAKKPADPSNKCYKFVGWYTDAAGTTEYDFNTTVEDDAFTLYAKWGEEVHTWNDGEVTKEATCTEAGEKTYTCTVCNATKTEPIAAKGHTWDEGKVTKEPTATEKGVKTYTCTVCGATKTEEIAATGHKLVDHPRVEPTATEEGTEEYWECSVCGFFFSDAEGKNIISNPIVIPPTGKTDDGKKDDGSAKKDNTSSANKGNSGSSAKKSSSKKKAIPQTGDATNVAAMAVAGIAGLVCVAGALAYKKH